MSSCRTCSSVFCVRDIEMLEYHSSWPLRHPRRHSHLRVSKHCEILLIQRCIKMVSCHKQTASHHSSINQTLWSYPVESHKFWPPIKRPNAVGSASMLDLGKVLPVDGRPLIWPLLRHTVQQWCNQDFFQDRDLNFKTKTKIKTFLRCILEADRKAFLIQK